MSTDLTRIFHGGFVPLKEVTHTGDPLADFGNAMRAIGLDPDKIMQDGKLHRCKTKDDKRSEKTGWYILYPQNGRIINGVFGDWRNGDESNHWSNVEYNELSPVEVMENQRRMAEAKRLRDEERKRETEEAQHRAEDIIEKAVDADPGHPYLVAKGIKPHGALMHDNKLLLKAIDGSGHLMTLQFIGPDGEKRFLKGAPKRGAHYVIGGTKGIIFVAEGFATAASVAEATGCMTVVAFDAGNLPPVVSEVMKMYPSARVVVAADKDDTGTGQKYAQMAADQTGCSWIIPDCEGKCDWNDIAQAQGLQAVRDQLMPRQVDDTNEKVHVPAIQIRSSAPDHLLEIPGVLQHVVDYGNRTARKPQPQFAVQAAIAVGSAALGRRFVTDQNNWPSLFLLNIGKSAAGKEHGKTIIESVLDACQLGKLIGPSGYSSDSGVLSSLVAQPSHVCVIDELGKVIDASRAAGNVNGQKVMRILMEAWGRAGGVLRPVGYSTFGMSQADIDRMNQRIVYNPALTILALTTPETFYGSLGSIAMRDGFLNRFLTVESDIGRQPGKTFGAIDVPAEIVDWAALQHAPSGIINVDVVANMKPTPTVVSIEPWAMELFNAFEEEAINLMNTGDEDGTAEMYGRITEMSMKLALIVARSCGSMTVTRDHAAWSIDYVRHYALKTVISLRDHVSDSRLEDISNQVVAFIKKENERGVNVIYKSNIYRYCRKFRSLGSREQDSLLNGLVSVNVLEMVSGAKGNSGFCMATGGDE